VIWSANGEGLLKYSHNDKIQCLAFNPVLQNLASCTPIDFGLWQADQANVNKQKVPAKCVACDWSPDGQLLAIGLQSGLILMKDKLGVELFTINKSPQDIWCLAFCPQKFDTSDNLLVAGSWDQKLSLYSISGGKQYKQIGNDKDLGFDPCSIAFYPTGEYMVIAGSDKKLTLWNKEGVLLGTIGEMKDWVWSVAVNPISKTVFAGANDGSIAMHNVEINTIHGLY
jgi:intraflagellar transport protein 122